MANYKITNEVPISQLNEGDLIYQHGRVFRLRDRKHYPMDIEYHENGVFTFRTDDLGDFNPDHPSNIPAHWCKGWVVQSNDNKKWATVSLEEG